MNKFYNMIGLAKRAGKVSPGGFLTDKAIKDGKAFLVIIAEDGSKNTADKFVSMCKYYEVPFIVKGDKENLGKFTAKEYISVVAVTDKGLAKAILDLSK